ncbi:MAG: SDR family NAD(P)-dependent oxidoreductase [Acidobacteriota bacterium]|nr:SDR family NAD(P)-dependent oxidoreductase [Acidobacteriota bacterium]
MTTICFTKEHLDVFSAASHDRNPLHLSDEYARRTPYGGRVVFGILDALVAIGHAGLNLKPGLTLSCLECEFFDVAMLGLDYGAEVVRSNTAETLLCVSDGRRPLLEVALSFKPGGCPRLINQNDAANSDEEPLVLSAEDLRVGYKARGAYKVSMAELERLLSICNVNQNWISPAHAAALLFTSYLVGMKIPGERALYSRLLIEFSELPEVATSFEYNAEVTEVSESGELTVKGLLKSNGATWASFSIAAHVRADLPPATVDSMERLSGRSNFLKDKVALVTGGSRGLGAALVRALALQGCTVLLNFLHSREEAEKLKNSLVGTAGRIVLFQGDASALAWCRSTHREVLATIGRLDILLCNASPALLPLWMEDSAAVRVSDFIQTSIALVVNPMAEFLPLLADSKGWGVVISSTAVKRPHPYFPHYVVAKSATEALATVSSCEYRAVSFLTVRPPRLLTDLTNTPLGRRGALLPEVVAAATVNKIISAPSPGKVLILEDFGANG